jgi:hypothetical protein
MCGMKTGIQATPASLTEDNLHICSRSWASGRHAHPALNSIHRTCRLAAATLYPGSDAHKQGVKKTWWIKMIHFSPQAINNPHRVPAWKGLYSAGQHAQMYANKVWSNFCAVVTFKPCYRETCIKQARLGQELVVFEWRWSRNRGWSVWYGTFGTWLSGLVVTRRGFTALNKCTMLGLLHAVLNELLYD